tara:strand:+ start:194 stop:460 length:267 start_codon:yes stop_codon:yes gene_type:complete
MSKDKNKKQTVLFGQKNKAETEDQYWERLRNTPQSQLTDKEYDNLYRYKPQSVKEKKGALIEGSDEYKPQSQKKKGGIIRDTFTEQYD